MSLPLKEFTQEVLVSLAAKSGASSMLKSPLGEARVTMDEDGTAHVEDNGVLEDMAEAISEGYPLPVCVCTIMLDEETLTFVWKVYTWYFQDQRMMILKAADADAAIDSFFTMPRRFDIDPDVDDNRIVLADAYESPYLQKIKNRPNEEDAS